MIKVKNLKKSFDNKPVLKGIYWDYINMMEAKFYLTKSI